jgi:protein-tyrosine kinase
MSLIERALGKLRSSATGQRFPATVRRPVLDSSPAEQAWEPQLVLTQQMREHLGIADAGNFEHQRGAEFRHIKRQVLADIRKNPSERVVLVASALSGEGKSFTSANLACSMAMEHDYSVLLVDADAVKPHLSRSMQLTDEHGLIDALADPACDVESLILRTNIPGLSVLPSGSVCEQATEYFASERMRQILEQLLMVQNRIVLIDALPLLLTTESRALVPLASQILIVVRAESTPQAALKEALDLVGQGRNVKLVLNAVVRTKLARYLGYSYGFEYDYSSASRKSKESQ